LLLSAGMAAKWSPAAAAALPLEKRPRWSWFGLPAMVAHLVFHRLGEDRRAKLGVMRSGARPLPKARRDGFQIL
jgi:hypothetical protein